MKLGIDLGTTYSMVAHLTHQGVPALVPDAHDASLFQTPSVVHVGPEGALVGQVVEDMLDDDAGLAVARFAKLKMGEDVTVLSDHLGREWSPEAVSALILRKLLQDVAAFNDEGIEGALLAIPAQFDSAQRRATKDAAGLAGLRGVELVEEPVAAAAYYGFTQQNKEQTLFVYDLGGGTFDATIVQVSPQGLFVLATEGSDHVGGKHLDDRIIDLIRGGYRSEHGAFPPEDPATQLELRRMAERSKIGLSRPGRSKFRQVLLLGGKPFELVISKTQMEELFRPALLEAKEVSARCLKGASLQWDSVDRLLLVGGSTHNPMVHAQVLRDTGLTGDQVVRKQPHQAVVYGASILASERLAGSAEGFTQAIANREVGLRAWSKKLGRPDFEVLIKRNAPLPVSCTRTFYTTRPDQHRIILELLQRKAPEGEPSSLGVFEFGPIERPRKNYPVEVSVTYDPEGLVRVLARDPETGKKIEATVQDGTMISSAKLAAQADWIGGIPVNF